MTPSRIRSFIPAVVLGIVAGIAGVPCSARADVERIREKALELEQKLTEHRYRFLARAEEPNSERIYKDFAFLLKKSKVDEVAQEAGDSGERLRLFLIRSIVNSELASFEDEERAYKQSARASYDDEELDYTTLLKRLATAEDTADRRKIYSSMDDLFETVSIFGNEIIKRRTDLYQKWGFANFADFVSTEEGIDLDRAVSAAAEFLTETQDLYDGLLEYMCQKRLGEEARKLKFYDLPFLLQGTNYEHAFPLDNRNRRMKDILSGLGVPVGENLVLDDRIREGKAYDPGVFPVSVPDEVDVAINPVGGIRDDVGLLQAVGEAQIYTRSAQTRFEDAYLANLAAGTALGYVPALVLDEPAWASATGKSGEFELSDYLKYRAFSLLYEARLLAATVQLEVSAFRTGGTDMEKQFKDLIRTATGARISSKDAMRLSEVLSRLESPSRFEGLLLAAGVAENLRSTLGDDWFTGGKAGDPLLDLWKQGGDLTPEEVGSAFQCEPLDRGPLVRSVERMLAAAEGQSDVATDGDNSEGK